MKIKVGQIYWLKLKDRIKHPHVIVKILPDGFLVYALTTNMNKLHMPGNILLEKGEGSLQKQSIVEVSKELLVKEKELDGYIGLLNDDRVAQIKNGNNFVKKSFLEPRGIV